MNAQLSMLNEQMADDKRTRDMLGLLNTRIEQLTQALAQQSERQRKPFQAKCARCPRPSQSWHPPNIQIDKGRLNGTFPSLASATDPVILPGPALSMRWPAC